MSKRKVAPVLQALLHEPIKGVPMLAAYHGREAVKELRALLAVARAVRGVLHVDGEGSNTEVPTEYWVVLKRLREAEARLARVSGRKA